jgi:hypothetical protein
MSAVKVDVPPVQISFGLALTLSCRYVIGNKVPEPSVKAFADGPVFVPHQLSSAVKPPATLNKLSPFAGVGTLFPTRRENVTDALPLEFIAPPRLAAVLLTKELVLRVSGPLSTMIAPPLPLVAVLLEKVELLIAYEPIEPLKSKRSAAPPPAATDAAELPEKVEPLTDRVPFDGLRLIGSPAV